MLRKMRYRLALDIGSTSIGWCLLRLNIEDRPCAIIRAGVRIFGDGRSPPQGRGDVGTSLAEGRRLARQMRRRRDRLLKRKQRLVAALVELGFWPADDQPRRDLANLDPYALRAKALDSSVSPKEFGRALFHLNQRRGFLSNRRTDAKDAEAGVLKAAIARVRQSLDSDGARTVGEWLARRHAKREGVRSRLRGRTMRDRAYDLYIDRAMVEDEFNALWTAQAAHDPERYTDERRAALHWVMFHQRALRPVRPGKCSLIPTEPRAALALPSTQRFRIFQELNHLRLVSQTTEIPLSLEQRDLLAERLEHGNLTFAEAAKVLGLKARRRHFNLQDGKRDKLKGNAATQALAQECCFGERWHDLNGEQQDEVVRRLITEPDGQRLTAWLVEVHGLAERAADSVSDANLPQGFGNLSSAAIRRILPQLRESVMTYDKAVEQAGLGSHSALSHAEDAGELLDALPYYGEKLERHVGFADPMARDDDPVEMRFGRIANPTVHIGLNELRKVVNQLIHTYGHPSEVIVELARELKQGRQQRLDVLERQAQRQKENEDYRDKIRSLHEREQQHVSAMDLQRMRLWVELNPGDVTSRCCPYTGQAIGIHMLYSAEVEVDHILPFSRTLDDSLNNKTVALRSANRDKGNRTPFEAFGHSPLGYDFAAIQLRAAAMHRDKAKRFAPDGMQRWLKDDADFLARALTDTAYLSRIAREYLSLVCPHNKVWVIPGRLTAMLRAKFGLNHALGKTGEKNRDDHRHHAVDAAVIGVTDRAMLMAFSRANEATREHRLGKLVEDMPLPWLSYPVQVARAVSAIIVSHRPDHGHQGQLHNDTAYGLLADGRVSHRVSLDNFKSGSDLAKKDVADAALKAWLLERLDGWSGKDYLIRVDAIRREHGIRRVKVREVLDVIPISNPAASHRHGVQDDGQPLPYKGYKGDSNYCIEIWRDDSGKWKATVISTFEAHQIASGVGKGANAAVTLRRAHVAANDHPLIMRLMKDDYVQLKFGDQSRLLRVTTISGNGQVFMCEPHEANVDARNRDPNSGFKYLSKKASTFQAAMAASATVSAIGELKVRKR